MARPFRTRARRYFSHPVYVAVPAVYFDVREAFGKFMSLFELRGYDHDVEFIYVAPLAVLLYERPPSEKSTAPSYL